jgi:circadian clock protein KaiB
MTGTAIADADAVWSLRLYIAGTSVRCAAALVNLRRICEANLCGRYELEVIDVLEHPELAAADNIVAIPTLIRKLPPLLRKIVGDLSNTERVLIGLELQRVDRKPAASATTNPLPDSADERFVLCLVIAGATPRSRLAVANLMAICDVHLVGRCVLEIVDIYQQPERAAMLQVVVAPTLLKREPQPSRRLVGDLSRMDRILEALGLPVPPGAGS